MMMDFTEFLFRHASFKGPGILKVEGPMIFVVPLAAAMIYGAAASIVWLHKDAVQRDKNGCLTVLFILLTGWPVSFLWWFWLRPPLSLPPAGQHKAAV